VLPDQLHGLISLILADIAESGSSEEKARALVTGTAERLNRDHGRHSALL
jgi:hypothetical protein